MTFNLPKMMARGALGAGALAALMLGATSAHAAATERDILVVSRALGFIKPKPEGNVTTAIVFDPANPASKADADALMGVLGGGLKAGKVQLQGKLVPVTDAGGIMGAGMAIVANGTAPHFAAIKAAAAGSSVLVTSFDLECVKAASCALGVATEPKVEIFANKAAAGAAGVEFLPAFLMMVKEL